MNLKKLNSMFKIMESNLKESDKPTVGIFWYSPARVECFGVVKAREGDSNYTPSGFDGMFTCKELHKYVWKKEYNYRKFHPSDEVNLFVGDYKDKPRGRIFYDEDENTYYIMVGDWIDDYPEAKGCIVREFNLNGSRYSFEKDFHWDIGSGYGD